MGSRWRNSGWKWHSTYLCSVRSQGLSRKFFFRRTLLVCPTSNILSDIMEGSCSSPALRRSMFRLRDVLRLLMEHIMGEMSRSSMQRRLRLSYTIQMCTSFLSFLPLYSDQNALTIGSLYLKSWIETRATTRKRIIKSLTTRKLSTRRTRKLMPMPRCFLTHSTPRIIWELNLAHAKYLDCPFMSELYMHLRERRLINLCGNMTTFSEHISPTFLEVSYENRNRAYKIVLSPVKVESRRARRYEMSCAVWSLRKYWQRSSVPEALWVLSVRQRRLNAKLQSCQT